MTIESVVVCVNYGDFLEHTLPENLKQLDRVVVVTHPDDKITQRICNQYGVDFLTTTIMHEDGDALNKGRLINLGLSHLKHTDWLVQLDADILLPHNFRSMLKKAKLNKRCIYGMDRLNTVNFDHWQAYKGASVPQHQWRYLTIPNKHFPMGARLTHSEYGWCPIGYFQLWHSSMRRTYSIINGSAEHSDVMFAVQWPREDRILLPEMFCYHLESGDETFGKNWNGRKTKPFGSNSNNKKEQSVKYCKE